MRISSEKSVDILSKGLSFAFHIQKYLMPTFEINKPELNSCIYAIWHAHQCGLYKLSDKNRTHVMVSKSVDGQIIANAMESLGMKTVRGSSRKKGAVEATMQMISNLQNGDCGAITVDGPSGPKGKAKKGIVKIAKLSQRPIVPMVWYSQDLSWIEFPSWDRMRYPFFYTRCINLYGEPIYVENNDSNEYDESIRLQVEQALEELDKKAPELWKKAWKHRLWIKKDEKINL